MRHEEGGMKQASIYGVPAVARWRTLPIEYKLYWLLRLGVIGCFIGHGAYGFITKEAWVPYFGVVGIDRTWAYWLMPWIGAMDVSLGLIMAGAPPPNVLPPLTLRGLRTAALRPPQHRVAAECVGAGGHGGAAPRFLV